MEWPRLVESKTAAHQVSFVKWNPGMDLLATVFENRALTCSRLMSLQKIWQKSFKGKIQSIAWRPDGRVLAIAAYDNKTKENICTIHDVEDGKEIHSIKTNVGITSVDWYGCALIKDDAIEDPLRPKKSPQVVIAEARTENFGHQLAHNQDNLNILTISTDDGMISLYALGLFHLSDIKIHDTEESLKITKTHMSTCMRYITSIVATNSGPNEYHSLDVVKLDTLYNHSKEMLNVAQMYAKITDELNYLEDTISAITASWTDVLAGLDNKLSSYCSRKNKKNDDSRFGNYTFIGADDLLQLLVLGVPSDNLEKFLTDMSDKGLRRLNNAIEQTCLRIQNLIVKNAQKCCYHLHSDLNMLRGMSLWRERYYNVGLEDKSFVEAMRDVGSLMLKLTELQQVIDHSLKSTKSFFKWLISIACRLNGEQAANANATGISSDANKTSQQEIQLITDFILENFDYNSSQDELDSLVGVLDGTANQSDDWSSNRPTCSNFTLEQVGQYLKNEPLTRLKYSFQPSREGSNFWIDFFKRKPELSEPKTLEEDGSTVLLFYPHRAENSLIQEYKFACKSIELAFNSVASNITKRLVMDEENLINLKEFVKNAPEQRLRIETDIKSMQHYTLFQTKSSPVTRQYLITQSLSDKSFKLISIEFQPNNMNFSSTTRSTTSTRLSSGSSQACSLLISDSSFYESRETKKKLLSFLLLDQANSDTLIVQLEFDILMQSVSNCLERPQKDISKIFRNNETIEKHSSRALLKLDLHTDTASERQHDPQAMMVKKIKGVQGLDMFASGSRGVIAFTSSNHKRLHLYELELAVSEPDIVDDEDKGEDLVDESLIDTDLLE